MSVISKLFTPLSQEEKKNYADRIGTLLANEDFQFFIRDIFEKAPPLTPSFSDKKNNEPIAAAKADGEKNFSRLVLKLYIDHERGTHKIKKATEQKTDWNKFDN